MTNCSKDATKSDQFKLIAGFARALMTAQGEQSWLNPKKWSIDLKPETQLYKVLKYNFSYCQNGNKTPLLQYSDRGNIEISLDTLINSSSNVHI